MKSTRFRPSVSILVILVSLLLAGLDVGAVAAQEGHAGHGEHPTHSPYADRIDRAIKALSDEDLEGLRIGAGMEMALPAELNGYPGPKHALELADALGPRASATASRSFGAPWRRTPGPSASG